MGVLHVEAAAGPMPRGRETSLVRCLSVSGDAGEHTLKAKEQFPVTSPRQPVLKGDACLKKKD